MVRRKKFDKKTGKNKIDKNNQKLFAFIASFFTIIGFIISLILWKDDKYVMFYAKQGLVLFLGQLIIGVLSGLFATLTSLLWVFWIILWAMAWINSFSGEKRKTWLIGDLAEKINF